MSRPSASLVEARCDKPVVGVSMPFGRAQQHESPCVLGVGHEEPCAVAKYEPPSLIAFARDVTSALSAWRKEQGVCGRCNGMTGIYAPSFGMRMFVKCPDCKGSGKA